MSSMKPGVPPKGGNMNLNRSFRLGLAVIALILAGCVAQPREKPAPPTPPPPAARQPVPPPPPAPTPEERKQAEAAQRATAIANAKAAVAREPMNWRVFNELGVAYYRQAMYDQAIAAFQQALALHPITVTVEAEARQVEAQAAQRAALEAKRQAEIQRAKDLQAQQEMSQLFGMLSSMAGASGGTQGGQSLQMLQPIMESLNNPALASPGDVPPLSPEVKAESSLQSKREVAVLYGNLGNAHFGKKSYPQAVAAFDNVIQLDPSRTDVLKPLANAQYGLCKYDECIVTLTKYHALAPVEPASILLLSESFHALGMEPEADKVFASFLAKQDASSAAPAKLMELGSLCLSHCRYAEAADFLSRARRAAQESPAGRGYFGASIVNLGNMDDGIAKQLFRLDTADEVFGKFTVKREDRGVLVAEVVRGGPAEKAGIRQGDLIRSIGGTETNDADGLRQCVMRLKPGDAVETVLIRDGAETRVTAIVGALPVAAAATGPRPAVEQIIVLEAEAQFGLLQPAKAIELLSEIAKPGVEPRAWYMIARGYDETGDREKAADAYQKALEAFGAAGTLAAADNYIQVCRAATGKGDEAIKVLEKRLASVPLTSGGGAEQWCGLGFAYEKAGLIAESMEILGRCRDANPAFAKVGATLARLGNDASPDRDRLLAEADAAREAGDKELAVRKLADAYRLTASGQKKEGIRVALLRTAAGMEPPPSLTSQAQDHYLRGTAALKAAKTPMDLGRALSEFQWAIFYAPWVGDLYFNTSAIRNLQNQNAAAVNDLKLYLAGRPAAANIEEILNRLYEVDYQREQKLRELASSAAF